jgi:hypothetical protein
MQTTKGSIAKSAHYMPFNSGSYMDAEIEHLNDETRC